MYRKTFGSLVILALVVSISIFTLKDGNFMDKPVATTIESAVEEPRASPAPAIELPDSEEVTTIDAPANIVEGQAVTKSPANTTADNKKVVAQTNVGAPQKAANPSPTVSRGVTNTNVSKYPKLSKVNGSYGQFRYRDLSGGRIEVDPQWIAANIVTITLPGLNRQVEVHRNAADNFIKAFTYIKNGTATVNGKQVSLLSLIKTMDGTWVTRHVNWNSSRGLSNHSWGTAIDINAANHFRYVNPSSEPNDPNLILWEKAFKPAGFSWGNSYSDSMHYELLD